MEMFQKKDLKNYLQLTDSKIINILKLSPNLFLLPSVVIFPTNICNYDCVMCASARSRVNSHEKMDFLLMKKIVEECASFIFKPRLHFSGSGEPLVYSEILNVMKLCKGKKMKWSMTTNGYLLEKYAKDLVLNNCNAINVSIHGRDIEHEKIVGTPNSFAKAVSGLKKINEIKKKAKKQFPIVAVNCVFNNDNILSLNNVLDTLIKLPINSVTFQHLSIYKDDISNNRTFLIKDKYKLNKLIEFIDMVKSKNFPIRIAFYPKIKTGDVFNYYTNKDFEFKNSCILPWINVKISPNGDVRLCKQLFGNLRDSSLKEVINSTRMINFRNLVRRGNFKHPRCFRCCHRHYY